MTTKASGSTKLMYKCTNNNAQSMKSCLGIDKNHNTSNNHLPSKEQQSELDASETKTNK